MYMFLAKISAGIRFLPRYGICISVFSLFTSGALLQAENTSPLELVNKSRPIINSSPFEPKIITIWNYNRDTIHKILKLDSESTRKELKTRLADDNIQANVRILYAGILAGLDDQNGQAYLINKGRSATELHDAENVFWMISHLDWLYPVEDRNSKTVNMKWAENFMLEMLKEPRTLKAELWANGVYERQSCAIKNFGEILVKMKNQELYPVLVALWNANPRKVNRWEILTVFEKLEDRRAIPILLEALEVKGERKSSASALAKMDVKEAIPILLKHLDDYEIYPSLAKYNDERILPALKNALPELDGYARGEACLMIINLEGGDRLPKLIKAENDPDFQCMHNLPDIIYKLKDERAVPFAIKELNSSSELYRRADALRFLAEINNSPAAIKGLIDALDINFNALDKGKDVMSDNNKEFRTAITTNLKRMTGQDFGENKQKWLEYYRNTYNHEKSR